LYLGEAVLYLEGYQQQPTTNTIDVASKQSITITGGGTTTTGTTTTTTTATTTGSSSEEIVVPTTLSDDAVLNIIKQLDATEWMTIEQIRDGANNSSLKRSKKIKTTPRNKCNERISITEKKRRIEEASHMACLLYIEERKKVHPLRVKETEVF
jgi:hypothetical protein